MEVHAAYVEELGPPANIRYGTVPLPEPSLGDVVIDVRGVALNPVDTMVRSGAFPTRVPLPLILGRDAVGVVTHAGGDTGLRVGQWVWTNSLGYEGRQGSWAENVVAPGDRVYPVPDGVDPMVAVSLAHPATTAALAFARVDIAPGDVVVIGAGGGNVGCAAITVAARSGATVIATASPADAPRAHRAGARTVIDHHDDRAADELRALVEDGAPLVWDTSGQMDYRLLADLVAVDGDILVTAAPARDTPVPWARLYTRNVTVRGFVHSRATKQELKAAAGVVNHLLGQGALVDHITATEPLAKARWAHEMMEQGEVKGRIVLVP